MIGKIVTHRHHWMVDTYLGSVLQLTTSDNIGSLPILCLKIGEKSYAT